MPTTPATVLLVEDEPLVSMVAEDYLRFLGFEPLCAATAREALNLLENVSPHPAFAVIDVGLPDIRGDELAADIRARFPHTSVIIASGYDPVVLQRRFEGDLGVRVMSKPYSEDDIKRAVVALGFAL